MSEPGVRVRSCITVSASVRPCKLFSVLRKRNGKLSFRVDRPSTAITNENFDKNNHDLRVITFAEPAINSEGYFHMRMVLAKFSLTFSQMNKRNADFRHQLKNNPKGDYW